MHHDHNLRRRLAHSAMLAALWWLLNRGDITSWQLGAPTVMVAVVVSFALLPSRRWTVHPASVLQFTLYFLQKSMIGSIDVASRVLRP